MILKKRILRGAVSLVLSLAMIGSLSVAQPMPSYASGNFYDTTGHWAERYISRAFNLKIVEGYANGRFMPDKAVTRAELVSMINNAIDLEITATSNFKDVTGGSWYYNDISRAVTAGYAGGYSDNTFRPNVPVTRQEAAVMLSKILPNYKEKGNLKAFRDYRLIQSWAAPAVEKMVGQAYMGGYNDKKFHPDASLTRAQAAKILCDILDNESFVDDEVIVDEDKTTLKDRIYVNDVIIDEDLGEGNATIDNCVILGTLFVEGGGSKSVTINNSRVAAMQVRKDDTAVRVVTKGTTVIPNVKVSKSCIVQTSGKDGTGIQELTVGKAAEVTLKGNFPVVRVEGNSSSVTLESGKITNLIVEKSGRYSDITLTGKAQVTEATVNAESYFHGTGTIAHMSVNADDITYETKPKKMTVGVDVDRALGEADIDEDLEVDFDPYHKDDNVDLNTKIILTFNTAIKLVGGAQITSSNIKNFVTLHTASKGGIEVEFTGTINAAKKVVTLTPNAELAPNTRYYVVLADKAIMNANGAKNDDDYIYFTTGTKSSNSLASYDPRNGARGVSPSTSITIDFSEDVMVYGTGAEVTSAYLQGAVVLKSGTDNSGSAVPFTATIISRDRITIRPTASLTPGQSYYVAVLANKFQTRAGKKPVTGSSATWTVAAATPPVTAATLSTLTLAPSGGSNVLTGFSPSTHTYSVTVPFGTTSVDVAATAASGTAITINGTATSSALSIPVTGSSLTPITVGVSASGLSSTTYTINVAVAGNTDLAAIAIDGVFISPASPPYAAHVNSAAATAAIFVRAADPNATVKIGNTTGTHECSATITMDTNNKDVTVEIISNMTTKTYTLHISKEVI